MRKTVLSPEAERYLQDLRALSADEIAEKRIREDRDDRRTNALDRRNGRLLLVTTTKHL